MALSKLRIMALISEPRDNPLSVDAGKFAYIVWGYDLSAWQDQKRMPWGLAGTGSLFIGIGIYFLGMAQTWVSCFLFLILSFH